MKTIKVAAAIIVHNDKVFAAQQKISAKMRENETRSIMTNSFKGVILFPK